MALVSSFQDDFSGGQNASKDADLLGPNEYFAGVNVTTSEGVIRPRWGIEEKRLTFQSGGITTHLGFFRSYEDIFHSGKFQSAAPYVIGGTYYIIATISGVIFLINQDTMAVAPLSIEGREQLNGLRPRNNWSPAAKYFTLFDYPAFPVIIEGFNARRADPKKKEIPISNIGGYNQNRLIVGNAGNDFSAGDPVGNKLTPRAPISFEEFLTVGSPYFAQAFQVNTNYGNDSITSIGFLQLADTSTGIGPLIVATQDAIYSYQTQNPRNTWEAGQFGSLLCYNAGIVGPRAVVNVNSDLYFVSNDGQIRSLAMSRDEQGKWSKTPLSREVKNWLVVNDKSLLQYTVANYFKNKIFVTVNPYRVAIQGMNYEPLPDYAFGGFVVLDMDNISTLKKEAAPAWAGLWTGIRPMEMVVNNDRCFVFGKDGAANKLYEYLPDRTYDVIGGKIRQVNSRVYTKAYNCETESLKQISAVDLEFKNVRGRFKIDVAYKSNQAHAFENFGDFAYDSPWTNCKPPFSLRGLAGASFLPVTIGGPEDSLECDPVSSELLTLFKDAELRLDITGINWELKSLRLKASTLEGAGYQNQTRCEYESKVLPLECDDDWAIGEGICLPTQM